MVITSEGSEKLSFLINIQPNKPPCENSETVLNCMLPAINHAGDCFGSPATDLNI